MRNGTIASMYGALKVRWSRTVNVYRKYSLASLCGARGRRPRMLLVFVGGGALARCNDPHHGHDSATNPANGRTATSVRATWLPVSVPAASPGDMRDVLAALSSTGVNRIYVDVWNNGRAYFNSSSVSRFAGDRALAADRLRWAVDAGASLSVEIVAWMEYGLMACYGATAGNAFAEAAERKGWVIGSEGGWQWLDPTAATPLLVAMVTEIGHQYGVAVQMDDHFACPSVLVACSEPKMHDAARLLSSATPHLSLSPAPAGFALQHFNVDWPSWGAEGLFDEVVPQLYTAASAAFAEELRAAVAAAPRNLSFVAGIRVDGSGQPTAWAEVSRMLDLAVESQVGAAVWYSDGVLNLYPEEFKAKWARGNSRGF